MAPAEKGQATSGGGALMIETFLGFSIGYALLEMWKGAKNRRRVNRLVNAVRASGSDVEIIGILTDHISDDQLMLAVCWKIAGELDVNCSEKIRRSSRG